MRLVPLDAFVAARCGSLLTIGVDCTHAGDPFPLAPLRLHEFAVQRGGDFAIRVCS